MLKKYGTWIKKICDDAVIKNILRKTENGCTLDCYRGTLRIYVNLNFENEMFATGRVKSGPH